MSREHREEIKTIIQQLDRGLPFEDIATEDRKKIKNWLQSTNSANFLTDEVREIRTRLLVHLSGGIEEVVSRITNQSRPTEVSIDKIHALGQKGTLDQYYLRTTEPSVRAINLAQQSSQDAVKPILMQVQRYTNMHNVYLTEFRRGISKRRLKVLQASGYLASFAANMEQQLSPNDKKRLKMSSSDPRLIDALQVEKEARNELITLLTEQWKEKFPSEDFPGEKQENSSNEESTVGVEDGKDQTLLELQVPIEGKTLAGKAHVEVRDLRIILKKRPTEGLILIESYDAKPKVEGVRPELFKWIQVERVLTKATGRSTFTSIEGGMTSSGISLEEAVGFVQGAMSLLGEEERNRLMKTFFEGESEQE